MEGDGRREGEAVVGGGLRERLGEAMAQSKRAGRGAASKAEVASEHVPEGKGGESSTRGAGEGMAVVLWCVATALVFSVGVSHALRILADLRSVWDFLMPNGGLRDGRADVCGRSVPYSVVVFAVHFVTWHSGCLVFEALDRMRLCQRFKITRGDRASYMDLAPRVLANQFLILLPVMVMAQAAGLMFVGTPRHGPLRVLVDAVGVGYAHDLVFYVTHRYALHSRWGYRWFRHDLHHRTKAECAASSMYMAPGDFVLEIIMPYAAWPLLVSRLDLLSNCLLVTLGGLGALYEHSGYDFLPRLQSTRMHAAHHASGMVAFSEGVGSPGLMDRIMRTSWSQHVSGKRAAAEAKSRTDARSERASSPRAREL